MKTQGPPNVFGIVGGDLGLFYFEPLGGDVLEGVGVGCLLGVRDLGFVFLGVDVLRQ